MERRGGFYDSLPPVGDPLRPDWSCLYTKAQTVHLLERTGHFVSELPKKGQPPVIIEFAPAEWITYPYGEVAWEPYQSDSGERLYSYKLWKTKPLALPKPAADADA